MTVTATFFEHQDFGGTADTFTTGGNPRFRGVRLGRLANRVTAMRATASSGQDGNVYGFTNRDFDGRFACLNIADGWTCWFSNVGSGLNDDIESALLVNRDKEEASIDPTTWLANAFVSQIDALLAGTPVQREGDPVFSAAIFPGHNPNGVFLRIRQNLLVKVDIGAEVEIFGIQVVPSDLIVDDYHCTIGYDIAFELQTVRRIRARVAHVHDPIVESGLFQGRVRDELTARVNDAVGTLNGALGALGDLSAAIALIRRRHFATPYVLPGPMPNMPPPGSNFGRIGDSNEGATIVLPLRSLFTVVRPGMDVMVSRP